ncbi:AAA family ATPase [Ruminococcus intestinalis]|uniref:AAA family ATPase n=1 Tax=Ruminococcus intestinalis TaxID=2763066 RepID=UPI003F7E1807
MIKSIIMKNCATYPADEAVIENCQKVNFFYGPNGSGKSTISNFLHNQTAPQYASCKINWENDTPTDIVVYNRDFRTRHFKEDIAGVFTLGEATIEEIKSLEEMKKERDKKQDNYIGKINSLNKKIDEEQSHKDEFRDTVWKAILKQNETDFQEAFSGLRGNKEKFRDEVIERYKKSHSSSETRESLKKRYNVLFSNKPEKCNTIDISISHLISKLEAIEKDLIWEKVIVGNKDVPISKLIDFLDNADWVNRGRSYIRENGTCPFCQQNTISEDFKQQLNSFFSGEYERNIEHIKNLIGKYKSVSDLLISQLSNVTSNDVAVGVGNLDIQKYNTLLDTLKVLFSNTLTEMSSKEKEAGKKVTFPDSTSKVNDLLNMISTANSNINTHNKMVDNYNEEKKALVAAVWEFLMDEQEALISGYINDLSNFEKTKTGIQNGITQYKKQLDELDSKIFEAGKNITSVQPTVDEINRSLKAYGFTNFQIVPSPTKENFYQIQRMDGTLATNTLSEGKETFISFLYFLQFAKGSINAAKVSSKKILVLDDPICSLDSTVLYIVSSMVKTLIKAVREGKSDVEQIFILTHNVFFHKEASFINGRITELNDVNYWIISKDNNISSVRSFGKDNPIKTSYELLWQELKTNTNASLVTTQNIMRRIIENYFGILGKKVDDTIIDSFNTTEEKIICRSLISWINDGSHSIPDDFYIDSYTDSVERYKLVFKDIFVKMGHEAHYNMMMS